MTKDKTATLCRGLIVRPMLTAYVYAVVIASSNLAESFDISLLSIYGGVLLKCFAFASGIHTYVLWLQNCAKIPPTERQLATNDSEKEQLLPQIAWLFVSAGCEAVVVYFWMHNGLFVSDNQTDDISWVMQHLNFAWKSFLFEIVFDFGHYWIHRACHMNKFLYKWVHSDHHDHETPGVLTTFKQSPLEYAIANGLPQVLAFGVTGFKWTHFELQLLFAYKSLVEIGGHEPRMYVEGAKMPIWFPQFPFLPDFYLRLSADDHQIHHSKYQVNFSKRFRIWDVVFGTYSSREGMAKTRLNRFVNLQLSLFGILRQKSFRKQTPVKTVKLPSRRHSEFNSDPTSTTHASAENRQRLRKRQQKLTRSSGDFVLGAADRLDIRFGPQVFLIEEE